MKIVPCQGSDGAALWQMAKDGGNLELNTPYCYLMMAELFGQTTLVAQNGQGPAGFVMAFPPPERPDTVFVWQIGVSPQARGQGLATKLLQALMQRSGAAYLEASVTPSNQASLALFRGAARRWGADCQEGTFLAAAQFPHPHEDELLLRIGPVGPENLGGSYGSIQ